MSIPASQFIPPLHSPLLSLQLSCRMKQVRQIPYINGYMWNLEKWYRWTYLQSRNRDTDLEIRVRIFYAFITSCHITKQGHGFWGLEYKSLWESLKLFYLELYLKVIPGNPGQGAVNQKWGGGGSHWWISYLPVLTGTKCHRGPSKVPWSINLRIVALPTPCMSKLPAKLFVGLTLCDLMGCSPPDSSVHGILQARILEWVAMPFFRGSSQPMDWTWVSCVAGRFVTIWATREALWLSRLRCQFPVKLRCDLVWKQVDRYWGCGT